MILEYASFSNKRTKEILSDIFENEEVIFNISIDRDNEFPPNPIFKILVKQENSSGGIWDLIKVLRSKSGNINNFNGISDVVLTYRNKEVPLLKRIFMLTGLKLINFNYQYPSYYFYFK